MPTHKWAPIPDFWLNFLYRVKVYLNVYHGVSLAITGHTRGVLRSITSWSSTLHTWGKKLHVIICSVACAGRLATLFIHARYLTMFSVPCCCYCLDLRASKAGGTVACCYDSLSTPAGWWICGCWVTVNVHRHSFVVNCGSLKGYPPPSLANFQAAFPWGCCFARECMVHVLLLQLHSTGRS